MEPTEKHFKEAKNRVRKLVTICGKEIINNKKSIDDLTKKIALIQSGSIIAGKKAVKATKTALLQTPEIIEKRELSHARGRRGALFQEYKGLATRPVTDLKIILLDTWHSRIGYAETHIKEKEETIKAVSPPFYTVLFGYLLALNEAANVEQVHLKQIIDWHEALAQYMLDLNIKPAKELIKLLKTYLGNTVMLYGGGFGEIGDIYPSILRDVSYEEHVDKNGNNVAKVRVLVYHMQEPDYTGLEVVGVKPWLGSWRVAIPPARLSLDKPLSFPKGFHVKKHLEE